MKTREQHIKALTGLLRRKLPRPFANVHWMLAFGVILAWLLMFDIQMNGFCYEPRHGLHIALLTSTVWIAVWVSSLRVLQPMCWRKVAFTAIGAAYDLLLSALISIVLFVPLVAITGTSECYGPRAKVTELVSWAIQYRTEINERFASKGTLRDVGKGLEFSVQGRVKGGFITPDGVIVAVGDDPAAVVMLIPTVAGTELAWKCTVLPKKIAPVYCQ